MRYCSLKLRIAAKIEEFDDAVYDDAHRDTAVSGIYQGGKDISSGFVRVKSKRGEDELWLCFRYHA
ncbi:hypothetical protein H8S37_08775 [Mediterraneibacter sp. NSJ-55]|uniref:Uncharacterized protein n=1 Tax=Mediterraneibacter hominis TaxID=2763054 RepID=A0A923LIN8_9FIRM|nr:hypothetical protein [Mediterraneibacter hominis]MBC5689018.1 hypothetical protein [Mediterraneibacter hominis]